MASKVVINPLPVTRRLIAVDSPTGGFRPVWRFSIPLGVPFFLPQVGNVVPFNLSDNGVNPGVDFFTFISAVNVARPGSVYYYKPELTVSNFWLDMPLKAGDNGLWWVGSSLGQDDRFAKPTGAVVAIDEPSAADYGYFYTCPTEHVPLSVVEISRYVGASGLKYHWGTFLNQLVPQDSVILAFADYQYQGLINICNQVNKGTPLVSCASDYAALSPNMRVSSGEHRLFLPESAVQQQYVFDAYETGDLSFYAVVAEIWDGGAN